MKKFKYIKASLLIIFLANFCQFSNVSWAKNKKIYQNGDISDKVIISEIFPNPKGKDSGNEWLELYNPENHSINLGNWSLVITNTKKNSKPKIIKLSDKIVIAPHSYLILDSQNTKFSLLNSNAKIELKDFVEKTVDSIAYSKTKENLSLSKIKKITTWTNPTKNKANPSYHKVNGSIQEFTGKRITIKTKDNKLMKIKPPSKMNPELMKTVFTPGTEGLFLISKNQDHSYSLIDYKITTQAKITNKKTNSSENWLYYSLLTSIIISLSLWLSWRYI